MVEYAHDSRVAELAAAFGLDQRSQNELIESMADDLDAVASAPYRPFSNRAAAASMNIPIPVEVINIDGLQYKHDIDGTALITLGDRRWSPLGEVWPHHFGDMSGNNSHIAVNAAIDWLHGKGGGDLQFPQDIYTISGKIVLKSNVQLIGKGRPVLNLLSNSNCTMIESESYLSLTGTGAPDGEAGWAIKNFYLNGRRQWNTIPPANEGHVIACYGRDFLIDNVYVANASRCGIICEYVVGPLAGQSPFNGRYNNLTIVSSGESGLVNHVSDSHVASINSLNNGLKDNGNGHSHIWLAQSGNCRAVNLQTWTWGITEIAPDYGIRIDTPGVKISGGMAADAKIAAIAVMNNNVEISNMMTGPIRQTGAHLLVAGSNNNISLNIVHRSEEAPPHAVILGMSGRQAKGNRIFATANIVPTESMIKYDNSAGYNEIIFVGGSAASVMHTGTPHASDRITTRDWDGPLSGYVGTMYQRAQVIGSGTVSAADAVAIGGGSATAARSIAEGNRAVARIVGSKTKANGRFSVNGDSQFIELEARLITTNDTPASMAYGATAALPLNSTWGVEALVVGRQTVGGSNRFFAKVYGLFSRGAGDTVASGAPTVSLLNAVAGWEIDIVPSGVSFALVAKGPADGTVRWSAKIDIVEILQ